MLPDSLHCKGQSPLQRMIWSQMPGLPGAGVGGGREPTLNSTLYIRPGVGQRLGGGGCQAKALCRVLCSPGTPVLFGNLLGRKSHHIAGGEWTFLISQEEREREQA